MLGSPSFRVRMLLLVLVVALPPLVAFGLFAVASTGSLHASFREETAERGAERAVDLLAASLAGTEATLVRVASDDALAEAVAARDQDAARERYASVGMPDWSAALVRGDDVVLLTPSDRGADTTLARLASNAGAPARGAFLTDGRFHVAASVPLEPDGETSAWQLVAWRDETAGLWEQMRVAAGGSLALSGDDESIATGSDRAAALDAADGGVPVDAGTAVSPLTMADGTPAQLVVVSEPPAFDFAAMGLAPALLAVAGVAALWAVLLAMAFSRSVGRQVTALVETARSVARGEYSAAGVTSGRAGRDELARLAAAHSDLARSLEERDRQIGEVAAQVASLRLDHDPIELAGSVTSAAARVTGHEGWTLAVVESATPELLPAGRYHASDPSPAGPLAPVDVVAWEALAADAGAARGARSFAHDGTAWVTALVAARDDLRAVLVVPWVGRAAPSAADLDVFALLGQHAGTAIGQAILYARLRAQATELERLAALQGDFLRGVTHDLQTPLTSIAALSSELAELPGLSETALHDLQGIREQAERLRRMVSQLLTVSRLGAGAVKPRQEVLRSAPLVVRTWQALRPRGRQLELEPDPEDHLLVADPDRLEQVLWAVLDNAVKYSAPGTPVTVRLRSHRTLPGDRELQPHATTSELVGVIEVTDRGEGMEPDVAARAFEQFYRSDAARATVPDGSGIGLYAARGLVLAMGGTVRLRSAPGAGTTVRICLPAEASREQSAEMARPVAALELEPDAIS